MTTPNEAAAPPLLLVLDTGAGGLIRLPGAGSADPSALPLSMAASVPGQRVWRIEAGDDVLAHAALLADAERIDVQFDRFTDGRGFSSARLLRERLRYRGRLRAVGDVVVDILFYLRRCGFDEFALRADQDLQAALGALRAFGAVYQPASDARTPLYALRAAAGRDARGPDVEHAR
jgi:uncharacterized protein (DUF934 family)